MKSFRIIGRTGGHLWVAAIATACSAGDINSLTGRRDDSHLSDSNGAAIPQGSSGSAATNGASSEANGTGSNETGNSDDTTTSPSGAWPNEPTGSNVVLDCGFDSTTCNGAIRDPYKTTGNTLNVVPDPSAPLSPGNVMRSTRFANVANGGTQLEHYPPAGSKEIYVGFWWRTNPEFMGKNHSGNKLFFIRGQGPGTNGVFLFMWRSGVTPTGTLLWNTQLSNNLDQCGGADVDMCRANVKDVPMMPGTWYRIEAYMRASSTPTAHDGIVRWWITPKGGVPTLAGNYANFAYGPAVDSWVWSETWDGSGPANEWTTEANHFVDHLRISIPNCGSAGCPL